MALGFIYSFFLYEWGQNKVEEKKNTIFIQNIIGITISIHKFVFFSSEIPLHVSDRLETLV